MPRDFIRSSKLIARKPHHCEFCGLPILPGTRYERTVGRWDGDWFAREAHLGCEWLMGRELDLAPGPSSWDDCYSESIYVVFDNLDVRHDGVWAGIASGPAWEALSVDERERMNLHAQGFRDAAFGRIDEVLCA